MTKKKPSGKAKDILGRVVIHDAQHVLGNQQRKRDCFLNYSPDSRLMWEDSFVSEWAAVMVQAEKYGVATEVTQLKLAQAVDAGEPSAAPRKPPARQRKPKPVKRASVG